MAHKANIEFYLYTSFDETVADGYAAFVKLKTSGIEFRHFHYNDVEQMPTVVANIGTWFPGETVMVPFVTYVEQYESADPQPRVPKLVSGLSAINNTDWVALASFSG